MLVLNLAPEQRGQSAFEGSGLRSLGALAVDPWRWEHSVKAQRTVCPDLLGVGCPSLGAEPLL